MITEVNDRRIISFAEFIFSKLDSDFFEHELEKYVKKAEQLKQKRISASAMRDYSNLIVFNTVARCEMNAYLSFLLHNNSKQENKQMKKGAKRRKSKKKSRSNNKERVIATAIDLYLKEQLRRTKLYRNRMLLFDVVLKYQISVSNSKYVVTTEADYFLKIKKTRYLIELKHSKELRAFDLEHLNFLSLFSSNVFVINTYTREVLKFEQSEREKQMLLEKLEMVAKAVHYRNPAQLRPNLAFCWYCDRKYQCPIFKTMRELNSKL